MKVRNRLSLPSMYDPFSLLEWSLQIRNHVKVKHLGRPNSTDCSPWEHSTYHTTELVACMAFRYCCPAPEDVGIWWGCRYPFVGEIGSACQGAWLASQPWISFVYWSAWCNGHSSIPWSGLNDADHNGRVDQGVPMIPTSWYRELPDSGELSG
jgi:hypothetical protein